jgi:hypothetical protein
MLHLLNYGNSIRKELTKSLYRKYRSNGEDAIRAIYLAYITIYMHIELGSIRVGYV